MQIVAAPARQPLTAKRLRALLHYDSVTGKFTWRVDPNGGRGTVRRGDVAGTRNGDGYIHICVEGRIFQAHRLAWFYVHDKRPPTYLDHRDTVRDHNWISNLRPATSSQNAQNRRRAKPNKRSSDLLGVFKHKGRRNWFAQIAIGGKQRHIGCYATPEEAHAAYLVEKAKVHPYQTLVNTGETI